MDILLTNDDGIYAAGLQALYKTLSKRHFVTVVAPERERSAVSHAITLHEPLRVKIIRADGGFTGHAVSGTPVDCIKLGMRELLDTKPDMVIAGINKGVNIGMDINYSGTVSAAKEAALWGLPAIAVSRQRCDIQHFDDVAIFIEALADQVFKKGLPNGTILNVNFPGIPVAKASGVRISRHETANFPEYFEKRVDPRNSVYYWQGRASLTTFVNPDSDRAAISEDFISITPIKCDMTDYNAIECLKKWHMGKRAKPGKDHGKNRSENPKVA
ncbi:MAG: 5'/3'-nucleotidase SurE [Desulfobacterales bacterium]